MIARKATGQPTVHEQSDTWVVRVDGIDTATDKHLRPADVGLFGDPSWAPGAA